MTAKLNQILAIEKGVKSRAQGEITKLHHLNQKPALFEGLNRTYQSNSDSGDTLPSETQKVQFTAKEVLKQLQKHENELMEVTARKDWTNMVAKADVVVDGKTLIKDAPVTYLLFLEKQLTDIKTFFTQLPVLDSAADWTKDENSGLYKTEPVRTHRTKKVQKPVVMYPATEQHAAQTQMITEDVIEGYWSAVRQSGAIPRPEAEAMLDRVETLLKAVKQAREAGNATEEVSPPDVGAAIFGYLLPTKGEAKE